ncbi:MULTISPECIES: YiiX/YebB-like N1pC/P60 family cysteine hydrolase [Brevibacillus]|jgi:Uncharacterized distant relative of cell wall-associated hydrolases|uniref:YiiX/YebB-like N1pC/P60 family cysteine hydrolase n=1 Tax=Brevibacillus TaxID=55080 RepID=UPI00113D7187|nr:MULTISPECIES: YiiX/YebB-like N1pC/P60 family cysteine hydrolase [Brevibacillus]MBU8715344.1 distant relative of cell wall-associated hydrolase-like protein [Brevibacillus parabrevis]MDH6351982.1 uncharacterized protein YycO [Brevibacillus sp. 1238]TGV31324.1 distant relative of cell wall-associated hydrolase-like protein [Mesorhizobium sp. M00.F.Ca.ET.186.01.1.1]
MNLKNKLIALTITALSVSTLPILAHASSNSQEGLLDLTSSEVQAELAKEEKETEAKKEQKSKAKKRNEIDSLKELKKNAPEKYKEIQDEQSKQKALASSGKMGTVGDILITYDNETSGWNHGHAAIVRKSNDYIVEAWPKEGVRVYKNNWGSRFDSAYKFYVKGADDSDFTNAQKYAYSQLGKPYQLNVQKHFTDAYYCSQLVWKAWYEQGFDVDADGGFLVTPADIDDSKLTVEY